MVLQSQRDCVLQPSNRVREATLQQFSLCDGDGSPNPKPEIRNPKEIREPKADSASSPFNAEAQRFAEVLLGKS